MKEISAKLKQRFCKDYKIPIDIFEAPYFSDRLYLLDEFYGTIGKWRQFVRELESYESEQDYFEEYNRIKDEAINFIKGTDAYKRFNEMDMNQYPVEHKNLPHTDIFKPTNDGRSLSSIDMKKANFSSLHHYDASMFGGAETWEEFIGKFTDKKHIIESKYIRQVILGNCNPKRHIAYEKYLMDMVLYDILSTVSINHIVFFSNDEIVIDVTSLGFESQIKLRKMLVTILNGENIPLRCELFTLHKIHGTDGYVKKIIAAEDLEEHDIRFEFKCLNSIMIPFVMRYMRNESVRDNDKVFYHEGMLAQFIETPDIRIENW